MNISRESLDRFFEKRCSAEEAAQVSKYLKDNPEVLEEYLGEKEWDEMKIPSSMPDEFWNEAWKNIREKKKSRSAVIWLKRTAVAASVVGILGLVYYQFTGSREEEKIADVVMVGTNHRTINNTTSKTMHIVLHDSSVVELSPQSQLDYEEPFQSNQRNIYLKGEAMFKVAKDKARPFTVYAGGIATTALGTQFRVSTFTNNKVDVKLFEGKVVVRSAGTDLAMKEVFLDPGQEFTVDKSTGLYAVQEFEGKPKQAVSTNKDRDKQSRPAPALMFDRAALTDVFEKIETRYNVHITYNSEDINGLRFTGTFLQTDSLNVILSVVCNMNELSYTQDKNSITIAKVK